jgi:hypothetical protein
MIGSPASHTKVLAGPIIVKENVAQVLSLFPALTVPHIYKIVAQSAGLDSGPVVFSFFHIVGPGPETLSSAALTGPGEPTIVKE